MARKTKEEKRIESESEAAFKKHGSGIEFDIFDLSKISKAGEDAGKAGEDIEAAVIAAIEKYRQN
jgi:hypothetical protein